ENFLQKRQSNISAGIKNEGRTLELTLYPEVVSERPNPIVFLFFGDELFTSSNKFDVLNNEIAGGQARFLHNDYAHLLYGTGIVGLFCYLFILYSIFKIGWRYKKRQKDIYSWTIAVGIVLASLQLFISGLGDGLLTLQSRVYIFYFAGMLISHFRNKFNYV
ncbi:MAG: hypothetical protein JW731_00015, partial [Bacteroidales bacterium]|nr:hypothetical protein [Bacteroidales bacterium]